MNLTLWLLVVAIGAITAHAAFNAAMLRRPDPNPSTVEEAISVLLPVRDEAHRVEPCLRGLLAQQGVPGLEIVVLDDNSTDGTADVVRRVAGADPRVRLIRGAPLPPSWLGKPHACQQLAVSARPGSTILAFVDADVVLAPAGLAAAAGMLGSLDLVSPYPRIIVGGWGERLVQPLLQWSWLSFLPLRAMERSRRPSLAAAGGQFLVVRRAAYQRSGGHAAVRDRVLEDIELARQIKRTGGRIGLADGSGLADCRMYASWPELVDGYTKSLWAAFGSPVAAASVVAVLALLYVAPLLAAAAGWLGAGLTGYGLGVLGRAVTARASGGRIWPDAFAHPLSIVLFGWLVARSYARRRTATWKGRPVGGAR